MSKNTHKKRLIEEMLQRNDVTCCTVTHIANANQYFCELEDEGFCKSVWGKLGKARVKFRSIPFDKIEEVKSHFGIVSNTSQDVHINGSY